MNNKDDDKLDRATLQQLIGGSNPAPQPTTSDYVQAVGLMSLGLVLGAVGVRVGFHRAMQRELKEEPSLKLKSVGPVSGLPARQLAVKAFVRGSMYAMMAASVFGVGVAYAITALRSRRDEEKDRLAMAEAEAQIMQAWTEAIKKD
jgi:hypothetical protein